VLTRKFLNIYGIIGVAVMAVMLILVIFKLVPTSWYLPLFAVAFAIWASRLVMRVILAGKERREGMGDTQITDL
jgi:ABC-type Fe3+-siderophore transport system permease subunit